MLDTDFINYIQDLLLHNSNFVETLSYWDDKHLLSLADESLISIFLNERFFIDEILQDNKSEERKNKWINFDPEHLMGYESKTNRDGTVSVKRIENKPFKICGSTNLNIEKIKNNYNINYAAINKSSLQKIVPNLNRSYKGLDVLSSSADGSYYLYDKYSKDILFFGKPPKTIKIQDISTISEEELDTLMNKQEISNFSEGVSTELPSNILTFQNAMKILSNSASHQNVIKTENYFITKSNSFDNEYVIFDKRWLKAIAEAIVKAKEKASLTQKDILSKMQTFNSLNNGFNLSFSLEHFLKENFNITDNCCNYLRIRLKNMLKKDNLSSLSDFKYASSLIFSLQGTFQTTCCDKNAIQIPSRLYLYLLSIIEAGLHTTPNFKTMIKQASQDLSKEIAIEMKKASAQATMFKGKLKNGVSPSLALKIADLAETHEKISDSFKPFYYNEFIFDAWNMDDRSVLQQEMDCLLIILGATAMIPPLYDKTTKLLNDNSFGSFLPFEYFQGSLLMKRFDSLIDEETKLMKFKLYIDEKFKKPCFSRNSYGVAYISKLISVMRNSLNHSSMAIKASSGEEEPSLCFELLYGKNSNELQLSRRLSKTNLNDSSKVIVSCADLLQFLQSETYENIEDPLPSLLDPSLEEKSTGISHFPSEKKIMHFEKSKEK